MKKMKEKGGRKRRGACAFEKEGSLGHASLDSSMDAALGCVHCVAVASQPAVVPRPRQACRFTLAARTSAYYPPSPCILDCGAAEMLFRV